jgi:hypothetical protein
LYGDPHIIPKLTLKSYPLRNFDSAPKPPLEVIDTIPHYLAIKPLGIKVFLSTKDRKSGPLHNMQFSPAPPQKVISYRVMFLYVALRRCQTSCTEICNLYHKLFYIIALHVGLTDKDVICDVCFRRLMATEAIEGLGRALTIAFSLMNLLDCNIPAACWTPTLPWGELAQALFQWYT